MVSFISNWFFLFSLRISLMSSTLLSSPVVISMQAYHLSPYFLGLWLILSCFFFFFNIWDIFLSVLILSMSLCLFLCVYVLGKSALSPILESSSLVMKRSCNSLQYNPFIRTWHNRDVFCGVALTCCCL